MSEAARGKFLIVEDERALSLAIAATVRKCGGVPEAVRSIALAKDFLRENDVSCMILDIGLPDGNGLTLLEEIPEASRPETILVTAHGEIENAISARKLRVREFFDKPINFEAFSDAIRALLQSSEPPRETNVVSSTFIGAAPSMRTVFQKIAHACASREAVLIIGETGTGKTTAAKLIGNHGEENSDRNVMFFHPGQSIDELRKILDQLDGGTLCIDPISGIDSDCQALLVNALELHGRFRLIATALPEILDQVAEGRFRSDLFYRLQVLDVRLPRLEERLEDIPVLVNYFLGMLDQTKNISLDDSFYAHLSRHPWPGNLRELRNVTTYAYTIGKGSLTLGKEHLPDSFLEPKEEQADQENGDLARAINRWLGDTESLTTYREISAELESILIRNLLDRYDGKIAPMAAALQANRTTIRKKLDRGAPSNSGH